MMYIRIQSPIIYNGYSYEDFPPTKSTKSILGSISNGAVLKKKKKGVDTMSLYHQQFQI